MLVYPICRVRKFDLYFRLGQLYHLRLSKPKLAWDAYENALAVVFTAPDSVPYRERRKLYWNRGTLLQGLGRPRDAIAEYRAILELGPHYWAHVQLGRIYRELGDLKSAIAEAEMAQKIAPERREAIELLRALQDSVNRND